MIDEHAYVYSPIFVEIKAKLLVRIEVQRPVCVAQVDDSVLFLLDCHHQSLACKMSCDARHQVIDKTFQPSHACVKAEMILAMCHCQWHHKDGHTAL